MPASMVRLAYNGLDTSDLPPEGERAALPWGEEPAVVIGVVCALRPEKGLGTADGGIPQGEGGAGGGEAADCGQRADAGRSCSRRGATRTATSSRRERNVAPWLRAMDIFVLPSLSEALSNSLMEAMGCGCCPLASDTGGNPELVQHGETGLLFPPGDAKALAAQLARVMDEPAYRRHLSAQAERRMHEHFTQEQAARTMGRIYEEFLSR